MAHLTKMSARLGTLVLQTPYARIMLGDGILAVVWAYYYYSVVVNVMAHNNGSFVELQNLSPDEEDND
ncbi:hypothetical protein GBA52_010952 [Prunus armeniaca]|nr:hypothetical protein GBA52_010952 [Prunus armeniaca]